MERVDPYDLEARDKLLARACRVATDVLAGRRSLCEAAHELKRCLINAGLEDSDPALEAFVVIDSETDRYPLGTERQHWDPEALARLEPYIARAEVWAREFGVGACEDILRRFGHLT